MKRSREYFFNFKEGNQGIGFRTANIPPEVTFRDLLDSIWFKDDNIAQESEGIVPRGEITDIYQIKENGLYYGTDVANVPKIGKISVLAWMDNIGRFTYWCSYPVDNFIFFGTKVVMGDVQWIDLTPKDDPVYSTYKNTDPTSIGNPDVGYTFVGTDEDDEDKTYLWIKLHDGNVIKFYQSSGGGDNPLNLKEELFVVTANEQSDFILPDKVGDMHECFVNGSAISKKSNEYSYADNTISFVSPLLKYDRLIVINNVVL